MARGHKKTAENPTRARLTAVRSQSQAIAGTVTTRRCTRSFNNIQSIASKGQGKNTPPKTKHRYQVAKATDSTCKAIITIRGDTRSAKRRRSRSSEAPGPDPEDRIQSQKKKTKVSNTPGSQSQRYHVSRSSQGRSERSSNPHQRCKQHHTSNVNSYHEQAQQQGTLLLIHASAPCSSADNAIYLQQAEQILRGFEVSRHIDISQTTLKRPESQESITNRQVVPRDLWPDDIDEDSAKFKDLEEVWRKYDSLQPYITPVKAKTSPVPGNPKGYIKDPQHQVPLSHEVGSLAQRSSISPRLSQLESLLETQLDAQLRSRVVTPSSTQYSDIPFLLPKVDAASFQGSSIADSQNVPENYKIEVPSSPVLPEILTGDLTSPLLTSESIENRGSLEDHIFSPHEIPRSLHPERRFTTLHPVACHQEPSSATEAPHRQSKSETEGKDDFQLGISQIPWEGSPSTVAPISTKSQQKNLHETPHTLIGQKGKVIHRQGKALEVPVVLAAAHLEAQKKAPRKCGPSSQVMRSYSQEIPFTEAETPLTSPPPQQSPSPSLLIQGRYQQQQKSQTSSRHLSPLLLEPREFMYKFPPPLQFNLSPLSPHTSQRPHSPPSTTSTPNLSRHPLPHFSSSPPSMPPLAKLIPKPHYILPPDPCPGKVNTNPDQVTRYLARLEQKPHTWRPYFAPVEVKRELRQWERGYWVIRMGAQAGWVSRKEKVGFWEVVIENIKEGRLGMVGVWLGSEDAGCTTVFGGKPVGASHENSRVGLGVREGDRADILKIYCWGKVAELIWAFLFVVSNRKTRWGLNWIDSAGEVVIRC